MEVITIEKETYEEIESEIKDLISKADDLIRIFKPEREQWLDQYNVCLMLNINKRTLQNYKDRKLLPFTKVSRKSYFKLSDVELFIEKQRKDNNGVND